MLIRAIKKKSKANTVYRAIARKAMAVIFSHSHFSIIFVTKYHTKTDKVHIHANTRHNHPHTEIERDTATHIV